MQQLRVILTIFMTALFLTACATAEPAVTAGGPGKTKLFTNDNFGAVLSDPADNLGIKVDLIGRVATNPTNEGPLWRVPVFTTANDDAGLVHVLVETILLDAAVDDYVRIRGTLESHPKNTDADVRDIPLIRSTYFEGTLSYGLLAPTRHTVEPDISLNQFDLTVTLQKIEFADLETRAYLKVKNATERPMHINKNQLKIEQGTQEYELTERVAPDYPRLATNVPPGGTVSGILVFPKIDRNARSLKLIVGASSENYLNRFELFEFETSWN